MAGRENQELLGRILDKKYRISSLLGEGGMGSVYGGEHIHLKRQCAIKIVRREYASDPVALKRFKLEAEAASILKHPNIIEIHDFGITDDELAYIVMEFLEGESLDDLLGRHKFLYYEHALPIFLQVCDALSHAHKKKVLHRDLKPANIMLIKTESGDTHVKLVDFGIAKLLPGTGRDIEKLTQTGEVFGSPLYMSPEQCMGQALDARSDVYALGCVLYQVLSGQLPFVGENLVQIVMKHINEMPPTFVEVSPDVAIPQTLEKAIRQCLSKNPASRYNSIDEVRKHLTEIYTSRQFKNETRSNAAPLKADQTQDSGNRKANMDQLRDAIDPMCKNAKGEIDSWMLFLMCGLLFGLTVDDDDLGEQEIEQLKNDLNASPAPNASFQQEEILDAAISIFEKAKDIPLSGKALPQAALDYV